MVEQQVERRLAAILVADIAGYSRMMEQDEAGTFARVKALRRELIDPKIAEHKGRIFKTTGDGILMEFPSAVEALTCAVAVQRAMSERNVATSEDQRIAFRFGIHQGDVIVEDGDIYGDGVNVAARLEALAEPGGICVSGRVQEDAAGKLDLVFKDLGDQSLKNIARPVRVYAIEAPGTASPSSSALRTPSRDRRRLRTARLLAAAFMAAIVPAVIGWLLWPRPDGAPRLEIPRAQRLSIVVLPFANLNSDPGQQYFADGITEDLTTDLSRIPDMLVISAKTAMSYRDKAVPASQISRELGVHYVVEGSVQRVATRVRVNAKLIDADSDTHLWAQRFDGDTVDLLGLEDEVTGRIANALNVEIVAAEVARRTPNPDAMDYILRGRTALYEPPSLDNRTEAVSEFQHALALDPASSEAKAWLAFALADRALNLHPQSTADDIVRADALATAALAASPRTALAHQAKGNLLQIHTNGNCRAAVAEFEAALALNRNSVAALRGIAVCMVWIGPIEQAIPTLEQAIRLDPRDPQISSTYDLIGQAHLAKSQIGEAIRWYERAESANAESWSIHLHLASAYALDGNTGRAATELSEAKRLYPAPWTITIDSVKAYVRAKTEGDSEMLHRYEATLLAGYRKAGLTEK